MRRFLLVPALLLAVVAGTARAGGSWLVVSDPAPGQVTLPSASTPSLSGALPLGWMSPPATPQQLSYPELLSLWQRAGAAYGIPWQVLAAINKVESNFGRNMGPSSAGAIGWMQFMPDTWLRWGTDANGDGVADPWNPDDAVFSAARYLAASGGQQDIAGAVFSYNHAAWYVNEVMQLANLFGSAGAGATFTIDRMQTSLDNAQSAVAAANEQVVTAQQDEQRYSRLRDSLLAQANGITLLSAKLVIERRATLNDLAAGAAHARAARAQQQLVSARASLDSARKQSSMASFAQGATSLLGAPAYSGNYVFPVGGGPSVVTASHTHHDYPAVDIAAPDGSPEYALSDAVVERAWRVPDPVCGLGITIRTADGLVWTYCHMAYVDPAVQPGAVLSAGQPVGLVGSTGDASGPHLHLQLQPATVWPQRMQWFVSFAGTAYRWSDSATPVAAPTDVFAVVSDTQPAVAFTR